MHDGLPARRAQRQRRLAQAAGHGLQHLIADGDDDRRHHHRQNQAARQHTEPSGVVRGEERDKTQPSTDGRSQPLPDPRHDRHHAPDAVDHRRDRRQEIERWLRQSPGGGPGVLGQIDRGQQRRRDRDQHRQPRDPKRADDERIEAELALHRLPRLPGQQTPDRVSGQDRPRPGGQGQQHRRGDDQRQRGERREQPRRQAILPAPPRPR